MPPKKKCRKIKPELQMRPARPCIDSYSIPSTSQLRKAISLMPLPCSSDPPSTPNPPEACACKEVDSCNDDKCEYTDDYCETDIEPNYRSYSVQDNSNQCGGCCMINDSTSISLGENETCPSQPRNKEKVCDVCAEAAKAGTSSVCSQHDEARNLTKPAPKVCDKCSEGAPPVAPKTISCNRKQSQSKARLDESCCAVSEPIETPEEPAPQCEICTREGPLTDSSKTCKTRNEKPNKLSSVLESMSGNLQRPSDTMSQKFGQALPAGFKDIGVDAPCVSLECPGNQNSGCKCCYPPAFNKIGCTGQITGSCMCGNNK